MKTNTHRQRGLTLIEILVVVAVMAVMLSVLLPALARSHKLPHRISCTSNLKQVGLAYRLWATDRNDQLPFASTNAESSIAWVNSPEVFRHYQVMSND